MKFIVNRKIMLNFKVLFTTTLLISLGFSGCFVDNSCMEMAMAESAPKIKRPVRKNLPSNQLKAILDQVVKAGDAPGIAMYISTPGSVWRGAAGVSDVKSQTPMHSDDGFSIASASKNFVAVIVLQLVDEGQVILDREISAYLPQDISSQIPNSQQITIRQLLSHTSGVAEYLSTKDFIAASKQRDRSRPWTAKEAIRYAYHQNPQAAPGQKFGYTDTNYILLQLIIEQITGQTLTKVMRDRILDPLALKHSFTELWEKPPVKVATGYINSPQDGKPNLHSQAQVNDGNGLGDGSIVSNGEDLSKFLRYLFTQKTLLSPATLNQMLTFTNNGVSSNYGLGIERTQTSCGEMFGHSGGAYGFAVEMLYCPSQDTTIVVLANQQGLNSKAIALKALENILEKKP